MYKTILVPLDGSSRAEAILPHVEEMARRYDAKAVLLKVDEPKMLLEWDEIINVTQYQEKCDQQKKDTENYLASVQERFRKKGIEVVTLVRHGSVVKEILTTAEHIKADMIAMASHGQGGMTRTFYGSIAAGVLSNIDRPLLLVRSRRTQ